MATDRDRFARTLDKGFRVVAFALRNGDLDAVTRCAVYVDSREREAEPQLRQIFQDLNRMLFRAQQPLPNFAADEDARIRRTANSEPAVRLVRAYDDVRNGVFADLAEAYAHHQVRWVRGNVETYADWQDVRTAFRACDASLIQDLARRHRRLFLGIGDAVAVVARASQTEILDLTIPLQ